MPKAKYLLFVIAALNTEIVNFCKDISYFHSRIYADQLKWNVIVIE